METPQQLLVRLNQENLFHEWQKLHQHSFLSHFFYPLNSKMELGHSIDLGYFDPDNTKITVFSAIDNTFQLKPEDDVFKKKNTAVEKLAIENVKVSFEQSLKTFKENLPQLFPQEVIGDGFLILQTYQKKTLWNFTFISKSLKFLNIKINAKTGQLEEHQTVDLIDKE